MKYLSRAGIGVMAVLMCLSAWAADGVAFITDLKGEVALDGIARPQLMAELSSGQKLVVAKDAALSVMFIQSGREYVLKGPGSYVVNKESIAATDGASMSQRKTDWRTTPQALVKVAQTSAASIRMRSVGPAAAEDKGGKLLYPTQGAIATLQPTLRWSLTRAGPADVVVATATERDRPVQTTISQADSYRLRNKLNPGTEYFWTVTANGKEVGSGTFKTLPAETIAQLDKIRPSDKATFSDRMLYAVQLNDAGATQDAQAAWARLAQERPDLPELAALAKSR